MQKPERLIVGHPFNPPHLVPLVEVVPSKSTDPAVVDRAVAFYRSIGKRPQVLGREIPGFVANRLQAALFREAVYLVSEGIASEQTLDELLTKGAGDFDGTVAELAAQRDAAEIRLMQALDGTGEPD